MHGLVLSNQSDLAFSSPFLGAQVFRSHKQSLGTSSSAHPDYLLFLENAVHLPRLVLPFMLFPFMA